MLHTRFIALCYVTKGVVVCECEEAQAELSRPSVALIIARSPLSFTWFYLLRQGWPLTRGPWAVASLGRHWIYYYRYYYCYVIFIKYL